MRPSNLLVYYGWLNAFNSATNQWNNEKVAQEMAKYDLLVFGAGLQDPTHGDYANTLIILARIKILNPAIKIFGYVTARETLSTFQSKVTQWNTLAVHGIFMDEAGYDYGVTRVDFNAKVNYVHGRTSAKICFANAWNEDHIIGTIEDANFPNAVWNPLLYASKLNSSDWYLLESFAVNTDSYGSNNGYCDKSVWAIRGAKAVARRTTYGLKAASVGIINDGNISGQDLFNFAHRSALAFELDAMGTADTSYGASTAATAWWPRPIPTGTNPGGTISVVVDALNDSIYYRYMNANYMKITIDHTIGAQTSAVTQW
jgi:hypothetical protein